MSTEDPRTGEEWREKGLTVAVELLQQYRRQMFRLGMLPTYTREGQPLPEWSQTDKINLRDAAVGLISDLVGVLMEIGGYQTLVELAIEGRYRRDFPNERRCGCGARHDVHVDLP